MKKPYAKHVKDYLIGVPAKDMSKDEWYALKPNIRNALINQGIMEVEPEEIPPVEELVNDSTD